MAAPLDDFQLYMATAAELLEADEQIECVELLNSAELKLEHTHYDNWDGGTDFFNVYVAITPANYARIGQRKATLEEQINQRLKVTLEPHTSDSYTIKIVPKVAVALKTFPIGRGVSRRIRQNIFDGLRLENVMWSGTLDEVQFLQRVFDLSKLKSNDNRYDTIAGDIWQHRVNNPEDWPDDWIYNDVRFNLIGSPQEVFLKFVCEIVHPVVRPNRDEALKLVQHFNDQLKHDGWHLVEEEKIAGRPRFIAHQLDKTGGRSVSRARSVADALDAGWMYKEIERLENSVEGDPSLAIGTAKELVETCCKTILGKLGLPFDHNADMQTLTKAIAKELRLVPEGIPSEAKGSEAVRLILQNLSTITKYLAELRNLYGSGHGRDGAQRGLEPRHARLAVGAAVVFIDFVTETYHKRVSDSLKGKTK